MVDPKWQKKTTTAKTTTVLMKTILPQIEITKTGKSSIVSKHHAFKTIYIDGSTCCRFRRCRFRRCRFRPCRLDLALSVFRFVKHMDGLKQHNTCS